MKYKIVETSCIPTEMQDVPSDRLIDVYEFYLQMIAICEQEKGIGLSAVQVGVPWNMFIVKGDGTNPLIPANAYGCFIGCSYTPINEADLISIEGCLSLKNEAGEFRTFKLKRSSKVLVKGFMLKDEPFLRLDPVEVELTYKEQGVVFQHEIDHAFQILISDIGEEVFVW